MSDGNKIKVSASPCLTEREMTDYIRHKLSPEQRNRVEKHLLECDLCADAMEGLNMMKSEGVAADIDTWIDKTVSVAPLNEKGKVVGFRFNYRMAAAIALLVLAGGVLYFILSDTGKNEEKELSQNIKPYKSTDTIHAANKSDMEETKALSGLTSKAEEKKTAATPATTDTAHFAHRKYAAKTTKAPSEQKQADEENTAAMAKPGKDTVAANLNEVTVVGYKTPLIDKGNTVTQTTVTEEEERNAPTRDANSLASTPAGIYQQDAGGALNARGSRSGATANYAKSMKPASAESARSKASNVASPANAQKDSSFSIALKAYNQKQYSAAVQLFDDYLKKYPDDEKATFYDAVSNLSIDSAATALTQLEQVLDNENSAFHDDAEWYKALALVKLQLNKKAKRLLNKIKNSNSRHSDDAAKMLDEL